MSDITISVIIPAIGRPSLEKVLRTLVPQMVPGDEIQVIGDGPQPESKKVVDAVGSPMVKYDEQGPFFKYGNPQRNIGIGRATGKFLWFIDDDDSPMADGILTIKRLVAPQPSNPHLFHVLYRGIPMPLLHDKRLWCGNVTGQCFVAPNVPGRLGKWTDNYEGDFSFISETLNLYPGKLKDLVYHSEITCSVIPAGKRKIS